MIIIESKLRQYIREMFLAERVYGTTATKIPAYKPSLITETRLRHFIRESILLTEAESPIVAAKNTAKEKIESLVRGTIWDMENSSQLDLPEEQLAWVKEYAPQIIAFVVVEDIIKISLGDSGHFDVVEKYQGDAFKWMYNQLFEKIRKEQPDEIEKAFKFAISRVANDSQFSLKPIDVLNLQDVPVQVEIKQSWKYKSYMYWQKNLNDEGYKGIIENYYQMLNFVQPEEAGKPAKRNIHLVADIAELKRLVDNARPRYQEFAARRKKDSNVVQEGTHMLIDNERWWVATIHNASAAYEHAKCSGNKNKLTDWCTAAPGEGAKFFKQYYREDDPLIIFKDKLKKTGYQFSFSSSQFMNASDEKISDELRYRLISLLETVQDEIDKRYKLIHKAIDTHPLLINDRMNKKPIEERIVSGHLNLEHTNITSLPDDLKVSGNLNLKGCHNLTSLPAGLQVGGNLNLMFSNVRSLPIDLRLGGNLEINKTNITSLPAGLRIGGNFNLSGTDITSLPIGLQVGGFLAFGDSKITSLPADLEVGDSIYGFSGDKSQVPQDLKDKIK